MRILTLLGDLFMDILVTNNPLAEAQYRDRFRIEYIETSLIDVLIRVRNHAHVGHRLLTHPLTGGLKPNDTPYKSILVSGTRGEIDEQSIRIIEDAVLIAKGFPLRQIPERYLQDLQTVDLSLIRSALDTKP